MRNSVTQRYIGSSTEHSHKPDYTATNKDQRKRRIKIRTVQTLHENGDISGEAITASERWLCDYLFTTYGYADYLKEPLDREYIVGDIHTFTMARGKAGARITEIYNTLGLASHVRLVALLVDGLSFSAIGKQLWPTKTRSEAAKSARSQCALLLDQLACFYNEKHKKNNLKKELVDVPQI